MEVDCYRLAYNTFHRNWQRFGIPEKDIPFAKTEEVEPFNLIIPGFSNAVVLFQITSRSELKTLFEGCPRVHNLTDFYTRFEKAMQNAFPEHLPKDTVEELPRDAVKEDLSEGTSKKGLPEVATKEDQSENTVETNLSEDNTEEDLSEISKKESLSEDARMKGLPEDVMMKSLSEDTMETCLSEDTTEEDLSEDGKKDKNKIEPEEVPAIIAYSLAISTELILYQYEDNKKYMKCMPDMWMKYFNEHMKDQCDEAGFTYDHLKAYSDNIWCSDDLLNKFVHENKNEYHQIMAKFGDFTQTNYEIESPKDGEFMTKVVNAPEGLCFAKMKVQFKTIVECCKCVKGMPTAEEIPLLDDVGELPGTPTSPKN